MGPRIKIRDIENAIKEMEPEKALEALHGYEGEGSFPLSLEKMIRKYEKKALAIEKEKQRLEKMTFFEKEARNNGYLLVAGLDEAGRGPLAGPVVAASVILPEDIFIPGLNDSKKLSPKKRDELFDVIREKAVCFGIGIADNMCIDEINILNATKKAMSIAINQMKPVPDMLLLDAVRLENMSIPQNPIIKGDSKSISIAAASILAKVTRDRIIEEAGELYPEYGFKKHKGYGTAEHIIAIKKYGLCPIHRNTFTKNFI